MQSDPSNRSKEPSETEIEKLIAKKLKESDLLQNPRNIKTRIIVEMKMREMYLTGFNTATSLPPSGEEETAVGWISVEDSLPSEEKVIAFFPNGDESGKKISTGTCWGRKVVSDFPNSTAYCFEASHWMPLPAPPSI